MKLYTVPEVAAETGLSEKAIRRRIEKGSMISTNRGNRRLIPESELDRLRVELGAGGSEARAFPSSGGTSGQGNGGGESGGLALEPIVRELSETREHVERLAREAEREKVQREQAEERARSEQSAREAAQAEALELRARVQTLEAALEQEQSRDSAPIGGPDDGAPSAEEEAAAAELERMLERIGAEEVIDLTAPAGDAGAESSEAPSRGRLARFLGIG
jgi:excisionase family DNA binding protein